VIFHSGSTAGPPPPKWSPFWMATGSGHSLLLNRTISVQIFYDWTQQVQVLNLMREDAYSYTVMHNGTLVWRLDRNNRTCCLDPDNSGVTPPRPGKHQCIKINIDLMVYILFFLDWLQIDNDTVYDGVVIVMEHECNSWTKTVPDTAKFSWLSSVITGLPCRLAWPDVMYTDLPYYSENRDLLPKGIFQVPDYCLREVTDPNCNVMHF